MYNNIIASEPSPFSCQHYDWLSRG